MEDDIECTSNLKELAGSGRDATPEESVVVVEILVSCHFLLADSLRFLLMNCGGFFL
jgi:hypothetical protein